jgi:hypothetical protein
VTGERPPDDPLRALRRDAHALERLLDERGRVTRWPRKRRAERALILAYLAAQLPAETMTEAEVNAALGRLHAFDDPALLRRALVDAGLLARTSDGSAYWKPEP